MSAGRPAPLPLALGVRLATLPLLTWPVRLSQLRPRGVRLDAAYWGLTLIHWIHTTLGAVAVVP